MIKKNASPSKTSIQFIPQDELVKEMEEKLKKDDTECLDDNENQVPINITSPIINPSKPRFQSEAVGYRLTCLVDGYARTQTALFNKHTPKHIVDILLHHTSNFRLIEIGDEFILGGRNIRASNFRASGQVTSIGPLMGQDEMIGVKLKSSNSSPKGFKCFRAPDGINIFVKRNMNVYADILSDGLGKNIELRSGKHGIIRFIGTVHFAKGIWMGVELLGDYFGPHDGAVRGKRYFTCPPKKGIFVKKLGGKKRKRLEVDKRYQDSVVELTKQYSEKRCVKCYGNFRSYSIVWISYVMDVVNMVQDFNVLNAAKLIYV
eukprot:146838_1